MSRGEDKDMEQSEGRIRNWDFYPHKKNKINKIKISPFIF